MTTEIPIELIQRLPKTDLHCHLDGSSRLDTVMDLARQQGIKLPTFDRGTTYRKRARVPLPRKRRLPPVVKSASTSG